MEKEHFLELAKHYTSLSIEDARAVDELQRAYPYSQVIHCLASRGARDHQFTNAAALLALSAVYSTDRAVLKSVMTAPRIERVVVTEESVESVQTEGQIAEVAVTQIAVVAPVDGLSGDALVEEVMMDLNRLQELKQLFETSFQEFRHGHAVEPKPKPEKTAPTFKRPLPTQKLAAPAPTPAKPARSAAKSDDLIPEPSSEALLNAIETSRKPVPPDSKKQKEQLQIIDQFITKQPSIPKAQPMSSDVTDLADKAVSLTDSMVSETLVEILLRQGKKDKAIEVLRKLIWKFPQKKAIFAAQIEELRK